MNTPSDYEAAMNAALEHRAAGYTAGDAVKAALPHLRGDVDRPDLDAIAARTAAATDGPWGVETVGSSLMVMHRGHYKIGRAHV